MRIFKYELKVMPFQSILMPAHSYDLSIQVQGGSIVMWSMVDENEDQISRVFAIFGTGQELNPEGCYYLSTVQQGSFVWHIFEVLKK